MRLVLTLILFVMTGPVYSYDRLFEYENALVESVSCDNQREIKPHMERMNNILGGLEAYTNKLMKEKNNPNDNETAYKLVLEFRYHLHAVFVKTPEKMQMVPEKHRAQARRFFQKYIAQLILKTIQADEIFSRKNLDSFGKKQQIVDVVKTFEEMREIIAQAHKQFRD